MPPLRLFYALWPDATLAQTLSDWTAQARLHSHGRPMRPETLHMTLAFLGSHSKLLKRKIRIWHTIFIKLAVKNRKIHLITPIIRKYLE